MISRRLFLLYGSNKELWVAGARLTAFVQQNMFFISKGSMNDFASRDGGVKNFVTTVYKPQYLIP